MDGGDGGGDADGGSASSGIVAIQWKRPSCWWNCAGSGTVTNGVVAVRLVEQKNDRMIARCFHVT